MQNENLKIETVVTEEEKKEEKEEKTNLEEKKENIIPQSRFNEVNEKMKKYESKLAELEKQEKARKDAELVKKWKQDEIFKREIAERDAQIEQFKNDIFNNNKKNILQKYNIPEDMIEFVNWNDEETIENNAKLLSEKMWLDKEKEAIEKIESEKKVEEKKWTSAELDYWVFFK